MESPSEEIHVGAGLVYWQGKLLITLRPKAVHLAGYWEFPGGKTAPGETPAQAVVREIAEETGISVAVTGLFHRESFTYPERQVHLHFFWCEAQSSVLGKTSGIDSWHWVGLSELAQYRFPAGNQNLLQKLAKIKTVPSNPT